MRAKKIFLGYLISAVNEYAVKRAEVMLTPLKMDKAAIKLSEVVKGTGEIKDTFKFTYDGKRLPLAVQFGTYQSRIGDSNACEASDRAYISDICG